MAIITISRGSFTGGKRLAACLADRLGYRCVDRDIIVERAAAYGASQEDLLNALERPPSFWDRFNHKKYVYLTILQAALTEEVRAGNAVYHGHAGHLLLRGVSHVLRARIIAPLKYRVALLQESHKMNPGEALAYITKIDQDRSRWTQYLYGENWGDPALYDLVLNLESVDIQEACQVIVEMAGLKCFLETPHSVAAMNDLAVASKVRAVLVCNPATVDLELEVTAHGDTVVVKGPVRSSAQIAEIRALTERAAEGRTLDLEELAHRPDL
jgi:cytidylate kinase